MKNKVLVLGGSGFLGNHVINALLLNDFKVCSVDLNPSKISHKNFDFISLNLSENILTRPKFHWIFFQCFFTN